MARQPIATLLLFIWIASTDFGIAEAADLRQFVNFGTAGLPGQLYIPPEAHGSETPRPVIVFLHGAGETGTNGTAQVNGNIDNLFDAAQQRGAFLYAPQAETFGWSGDARTSNVLAMLDNILADENADPNRVYVTGLSMGGGGTWNMVNRFSDRFAAAVPIAAVSPEGGFDATEFADKPTWAFHARNDRVVSMNASRNVVNRILSTNGEPQISNFPASNDTSLTFEYTNDNVPIRYTEWPSGGHGIWGRVYDTDSVYDWMFSQQTTGNVRPEGIAGVEISSLNGPYSENFDILGSDAATTGITLPDGWTSGTFSRVTTKEFPIAGNVTGGAVYNAGGIDSPDRTLAVGVSSNSQPQFLQFRSKVAGADASSLRLQFDIEAWDSRDGIFVQALDRYLGLPDDPGEAAFSVSIEMDSGNGFSQIMDLGTVTTGPNLQHVPDSIVDGNAPESRISFDSGIRSALIPEDARLRIRWSTVQGQSQGWVFGLDNVVLDLMSSDLIGDFNGDGSLNVKDMDALTAAINSGDTDSAFDVDQSGVVDSSDRQHWLTEVFETIPGDVNLDREVNAEDLNLLGLNWLRTDVTSYSDGDLDGDGNVGASDLNEIGRNWQMSSASTAPVPEPSNFVLLLLGLFCIVSTRAR